MIIYHGAFIACGPFYLGFHFFILDKTLEERFHVKRQKLYMIHIYSLILQNPKFFPTREGGSGQDIFPCFKLPKMKEINKCVKDNKCEK